MITPALLAALARYRAAGGDPDFANVVLLMHLDGADGSASFVDVKSHVFTAQTLAMLLLNFNGSNGSTTFTDSSWAERTTTSFNGAALSTAQSKFGGSSLLLTRSSSQYATCPNTPNFDFGSGDFCLEAWIRPSSLNDGNLRSILTNRATSTADPGFYFYINGTGKIGFQCWGPSAGTLLFFFAGTTTLSVNTWYHVAVTRSGNNWYLFLDGVQEATTSVSGSIAGSTFLLNIGRDPSVSSRHFDGYIDDLRVTKGIARYTAGFTPPGELPDTGARLSTAQLKFGTASVELDRAALIAYADTPASTDFDFGSGDFCVEGWIRPHSGSGIIRTIVANRLIDRGDGSGSLLDVGFSVGLNTSSQLTGAGWDGAGGPVLVSLTGSTTVTANVWSHFAFTRSGNTYRLFLNGTQDSSTVVSGTIAASIYKLRIGLDATTPVTRTFDGYIDDVRITKGVARYTANFTPPTAAFPDSA